jgi:hypothetical protein
MPRCFTTTQEGEKFSEKHGSMNIGSDSSILFLSHILPSPKDTHKEVSDSHSDIVIYPLDNPNKLFPNPYKRIFLHASDSTAQTTFKHHQPSASTLDKSSF